MFKHILVPLDGSVLAEAVLPMVKAISQAFASEITLLRVVHRPQLMGSAHDFAEMYISLFAEMQREAAAYIEAQEEVWRADGFRVNGRIIDGESTADIILDIADELGVDAIAMSTHGRGGIRRWVFGSVADKVLRHAQVPILLVRAQPDVEEKYAFPAVESIEDIRSHEVEAPVRMGDPELW